MISKERLEELIKQGATIWSRYDDLIKKEPILINLSSLNQENTRFKLYNDKNGLEIYDYDNLLMYQLEDLYETKKQAEWALKYQRIPHTEYLDLPMFEDFGKHPYLSFYDEVPDLYELKIDNNANIVLIMYRGGIYDCGIIKFSKEFTEENYTEVCDLCVKLFEGE